MTTRNGRIRFGENNFAELITSQITYSSQLTSFPFSNAINKFRSRTWKPSGHFLIDSTNKEIYINDGADKTVSLTESAYTTPDLLATEIQTKLNASSANWTVTYLTGTYSFKIENTGSVTLRLATTTNAIWDTIGFTTSSNLTGTIFTADQQRNHTSEYAIFDLGYNAEITLFSLLGPLNEAFNITNMATVTLSGSNLDQWTAPPFSIALVPDSKGIYKFLDDQVDTSYRFWRLDIIDKLNPAGPEGFSIGVIYLGDYLTLTNRNIGGGFGQVDVDPSEVATSESGVLHFDLKTKYRVTDGATISYLDRDDKDKLRLMFEQLGKTTPFLISLDPTLCLSDELSELTQYVVFNAEPKLRHIFNDVFSMSLSVREVV